MPYKDPEQERENAREYSNRYRERHYEEYRNNENTRARKRWKNDIEYKQRTIEKNKQHRLAHKEQHNKNTRQDYIKFKQKRISHKIQYHKKKYETDEEYRKRVLKQNRLNWERHGEKYNEKHKPYLKKYYKTENGKSARARGNSKRRGLEHIELFPNIFDPIEKTVKHHINNNNVVHIPEDLHLLYYASHDSELHREKLRPIVEQLYPELKKEEMVRSLSTGTSPVLG